MNVSVSETSHAPKSGVERIRGCKSVLTDCQKEAKIKEGGNTTF